MTTSDSLDALFSALSHPVRREILAKLSKGNASVNELADPFDMSLPAISRHIKILENAGLIDRHRDAQSRPCALNTAPLDTLITWTEHYRKVWAERFDKMEEVLKATTVKEDKDG